LPQRQFEQDLNRQAKLHRRVGENCTATGAPVKRCELGHVLV
jgi:hypothetical protein